MERAIGLGQGRRTGLFGVPQVPEHTATDNRGQVRLGGETMRVLLIGEEIDRERQSTPRQHRHQPLVAERTDEAIQGHGRDVIEHGAQLQTEASVRCQQGITSHLGAHLAIAQDEVREDREHRATRGTLETPDGDATQPNTDVMGVAGLAPTTVTGRLVFQLQAKSQEEGKHELKKPLAITKQLEVGGFILEIDGDGPVFAGLAGWFWHGSPSGHWVLLCMTHLEVAPNDLEYGVEWRPATTKSDGIWDFHIASICTKPLGWSGKMVVL